MGAGKEELVTVLVKNDTTVHLGRNNQTLYLQQGNGPAKNDKIVFLSRKHALLSCRSGKLFIVACSREPDLVFVNGIVCPHTKDGKTELKVNPGDEISLLGNLPVTMFNYKVGVSVEAPPNNMVKTSVEVVPEDPEPLTIAVAPVAAVDPVEEEVAERSPRPVCKNQLERDLECSICFELIACAHTINSCECGNSYCYTCIQSMNLVCPLCRNGFTKANVMPNRLVDDIARSLLKDDPEALEELVARCERGLQLKKGKTNNKVGGIKPGNKLVSIPPPTTAAAKPVTTSSSAATARTAAAPVVQEAVDLTIDLTGVIPAIKRLKRR